MIVLAAGYLTFNFVGDMTHGHDLSSASLQAGPASQNGSWKDRACRMKPAQRILLSEFIQVVVAVLSMLPRNSPQSANLVSQSHFLPEGALPPSPIDHGGVFATDSTRAIPGKFHRKHYNLMV